MESFIGVFYDIVVTLGGSFDSRLRFDFGKMLFDFKLNHQNKRRAYLRGWSFWE